MFSGALTLLSRALREDATRRRAHLFRLCGTLLILIFLIVAHASSGGIAAPGRRFFELISWLNLWLIVLAGASYFATAITEEKEQGTLGLLQLAGVSSLGLLLGKSTSRLIAVLLIFLGQLPFALLAITLGGITARQIIAVDISLAAFLVLVANVGLLSSVLMRRSGTACAWVLLGLALLLFGVHYGDDSLAVLIRRGSLSADSVAVRMAQNVFEKLNDVSIFTRLEAVLITGYDGPLIGRQAGLHAMLGGAAFLASWITFNRFTRYSDVAAPSRGWLPRRHSHWRLLIPRPGRYPLIWKDYHFITGGNSMAVAKLLAYPTLLLVMWRFQESLRYVTGQAFPELSRNTMLVIMAGEMCFYASRMFHEEFKWGTLPSLAILPRPLARTAYGKVAGCLAALLPAACVLLGLVLIIPPTVSGSASRNAYVWWMLLVQLAVLLHLTALFSLTVKWGALSLAVATLLVLNALLSLPLSLLLAGMAVSYNDDNATIGPIIYFGCGVCGVLQMSIARYLRIAAARSG